jgi:cytidine deaminase
MRKGDLNISYRIYANLAELENADAELMLAAEKSLANAYAVYSGFRVGAALLLENGEVILGNNQENIAFPSSMCAERVTLYYCKANYPDVKILKIAITAKASSSKLIVPVTPCGACRQVMSEYERIQDTSIEVILKGEEGEVFVFDRVTDLLPLAFQTEAL